MRTQINTVYVTGGMAPWLIVKICQKKKLSSRQGPRSRNAHVFREPARTSRTPSCSTQPEKRPILQVLGYQQWRLRTTLANRAHPFAPFDPQKATGFRLLMERKSLKVLPSLQIVKSSKTKDVAWQLTFFCTLPVRFWLAFHGGWPLKESWNTSN